MTRRIAALFASAAMGMTAAVLLPSREASAAQPVPMDQPPTWASLSKPQQSVLAPLQRDWTSIDTAGKQKWLEVATRFPNMPEGERLRVQKRMSAWAAMTPLQRGHARLQFQESRQFTPEDRQARWEAYQALPDDQRRELRSKTATPPPPPLAAAESSAKRNTLSPARPSAPKPVAPTLVQAKPGATTSLMSAQPPQGSHQQPGLPKIAATEGFVNPSTLLPRRGPQGAAVQASAPPAAAAKGP